MANLRRSSNQFYYELLQLTQKLLSPTQKSISVTKKDANVNSRVIQVPPNLLSIDYLLFSSLTPGNNQDQENRCATVAVI